MNLNELNKLLSETAERISKEENKCGQLVFSQNKVREPELREVLSRVFSEQGISYGIEVPTEEKHSFSGERKKSARVDISVYENGLPSVHIELKEGQPVVHKIEKDFEKLMLEKVQGTCFFHVLRGANSGTFKSVLGKYEKAYIEAKAKLQGRIQPKWFLLFIFVVSKEKHYYKEFEDISSIPQGEFTLQT